MRCRAACLIIHLTGEQCQHGSRRHDIITDLNEHYMYYLHRSYFHNKYELL